MTVDIQAKHRTETRDETLELPQMAAGNRVHDDLRRIAAAYGTTTSDFTNLGGPDPDEEDLLLSGLAAAIAPETPAEACLVPALAAAGWTGVVREVKEALPHFSRVRNIDALRGVLARLNYETFGRPAKLRTLTTDMMPCLFCTNGTDVKVVVDRSPTNELLFFDGGSGTWRLTDPASLDGVAYPILPPRRKPARSDGSRWLTSVIGHFKPVIWKLFLLNFLINLAGLALPLFVMHVYDLGIGARAMEVVLYLALGALIVITTDLALRRLRAYAVSYFGSRLDAIIAMASFRQLLHMPVSMIESASITMQIARLRQFESIRDAFAGTLATAIIDAPFILLFIAAIALIGGHLVWIPASLLVVYAVLAIITLPLIRRQIAKTGEAKSQLQQLLIETIAKRAIIRDLNAERVWIARHQALANDSARQNYRSQLIDGFIQNLSQTLVSLSGILTLGFGTLLVISGAMTTGALIGVMTLVWRVLSPLQSTFLALTRLEQAIQSFRHINRLMEIPVEREPGQRLSFRRKFSGGINVSRLVFRHARSNELTLRGIDLRIMPGEVVAVTGKSGSGKSTLLKLIAGLYPVSGGAILADGIDIRQLDPAEWRSAIAYAPQGPAFFFGTVSQNIRLACPEAMESDVERAAHEMGLGSYPELFPQGLGTKLSPAMLERLPEAIKQRLSLARCFVKTACLYLLDRPEINLDDAGAAALVGRIESLKTKATVIFTTHRPSHMLLANRLVVLDAGQIVMDGPTKQVLEKLNAR